MPTLRARTKPRPETVYYRKGDKVNPQEAIDILATHRRDHHSFSTDIIGQAEQLGKEALERIQDCRTGNPADVELPLPSETD